jgi:rhamnogalacturonan endolyase
VSRRAALGLLGAAAAVIGTGDTAAASPSPGARADVELVDNGDTITLNNGLVSATLVKATGQTTEIGLVGSRLGNADVNLVGGRNGNGYSTFNYTVGASAAAKGMSGADYRVVSRSPERVEVAMTVDDPATLPFVVELHATMERATAGIYYHMVYRYPPGMPDGLSIQQLRYAVAAGDPSFTSFVVDDARGVRQRPTIAETQASVTLQDTTYVLPDGRVYSKYQNISNLEGDNHVFMISNGRLGMSVIQANKDYFCGGPTKQELTCHDYYDGEILLWHPFTSHYGSPAMFPHKGWEKIYGPFLLYVNEGADVSAMWTDAKRAAERERRRWPYRWLADPLYAAEHRSTVSGRLTITDGSRPAHAWVVLAPPGVDWQYQSTGYVYFARADAHGRFAVPAVREGTYTLSAFVDGVLGEYTMDSVTVPAGDLGRLVWRPRSHGRTLWQIGTPDRSTGEFHVYGGADGFRQYLTWLEYPYEFPDGVDFTVGVDDPRTKWNFFQPCYRTPGTPAQLAWRGTPPDHTLTTWRIRFAARHPRQGTGTLDIALASSVFGTLRVALNGQELASVDPLPGPPGDNGSYRLAERSMYRLLDPIQFPAGLIRTGENVIELSPVRPPKAPLTAAGTVDDWMEPMGGVMYDFIRLQVE